MEIEGFDFNIVLYMELFVTIHMSIFVFWPISSILAKEKGQVKKIFLILFCLRAFILLMFDLLGYYLIAIFDFLFVFFGAFVLVPILFVIFYKRNKERIASSLPNVSSNSNVINSFKKCVKCGSVLTSEDVYCPDCGEKVQNSDSNYNNSEDYYQTLIDEVKKKENK